MLFFFLHLLVPSCIFPVYFLEPLGSFLVNILFFIDKKKELFSEDTKMVLVFSKTGTKHTLGFLKFFTFWAEVWSLQGNVVLFLTKIWSLAASLTYQKTQKEKKMALLWLTVWSSETLGCFYLRCKF